MANADVNAATVYGLTSLMLAAGRGTFCHIVVFNFLAITLRQPNIESSYE